jgi:hypothetical protein
MRCRIVDLNMLNMTRSQNCLGNSEIGARLERNAAQLFDTLYPPFGTSYIMRRQRSSSSSTHRGDGVEVK